MYKMSTESTSSDNKVISKSTRLLEENALTIHKWLLFSVAIFSLVFSFISVLLGDYTQAWISILSVPGVCIAYILMRMQLLYFSKLFNAAQIIVMIASISLLTGINSVQLKKLREGISFTTLGTNNEKGNGFGLQLVKEFLRRHKSHLEIQSEFGKGSVFSFNL
jgi:hypothetical protein